MLRDITTACQGMSEFVEITKTRFEYSLFFLVNSSLFIISNSTMLGTKRKTTEQNQPEAKSTP